MMSAMDTLTVLKELMNMTTAVLTITNIMVDMLIIVMNQSKSTPLWNIILEVRLESFSFIKFSEYLRCFNVV